MTTKLLDNRWDDAKAAGMSESERLLYRSNLLGSDKRITNYGGGNTSAKVEERDPLTGETVTVLWVKGSGGDVGTMKLDGFATLYQSKLEQLRGIYRGPEHEDEMVGLLSHCTFNLNPRASSIDTPLHAYLPYTHVDHMHPDAVIAIAATGRSRELTRDIYGEEIGWLPWRRPGFQLGLDLSRFAAENPHAKGVVLESHGLFTWGETAKDCYETTLRIINRAIEWFDGQLAGKPAFGGEKWPARDVAERRQVAARLMPEIRARIGVEERKIGHFDDSPAVLEFVGSNRLDELAALGTSCPDHFLRTKIRPLVLPYNGDLDALVGGLDAAVEAYREGYRAYYERCRHDNSPAIRDPNAVIYLVPGVGMLSFAKDKATARIASEFYVNAINVMRGASGVDTYQGLPEQEAFDIEYWLLEEAKLQRMPKPKSLAGRIAFVTGGAGGIGRATAERLMGEGACVVLADIDAGALDAARADFAKRFGADQVRGVIANVTDEGLSRRLSKMRDGIRRPRHSRVQCRHRFGLADRGYDSRGLEPQYRHSRDRLFPRLARGLPAVPQAEARRLHRLHRLEERSGGLRRRVRLLHGESCGNPSGALPRPGGRGGRHPREHREPRRRAARLQDLERRVARAARGVLQDRRGAAGGALSSALAPEAFGLPGGHRGSGLLPRERPVGQVHRQYRECGRGQPDLVHALIGTETRDHARPGDEAGQFHQGRGGRRMAARIDRDVIDKSNEQFQEALEADYAALGARLDRRGIAIDDIKRKVAGFTVAVPSWGVGTGGTRFARFPGGGEPRGIFEKLDDCAVINDLGRATPAVSLHIPWDKADPPTCAPRPRNWGSASMR